MIIVTGGTGFVGSAVARELVRRGETVAVLGRDEQKIKQRFPAGAVEARQGDVRDAGSLRSAFGGADTVIDCVQFPNSPVENKRKGWTFEEIDYKGTLNQIQAARAAGVGRYVYVSGVGAAPDAKKHWFGFKWLAEDALRHSGMTHVIVRPTWVYGPDDVALNRFLGFARRLQFVPLFGDGRQLMQPIFVDDLAWLLAEAGSRHDLRNSTFEAGGPEVLPMNDVIQAAMDVAGVRRPILHQPIWLGKLMASLVQFLPGPPLTPDAVDFITAEATADNSAVERTFAPRLTPLSEGLGSYLGGGGAVPAEA